MTGFRCKICKIFQFQKLTPECRPITDFRHTIQHGLPVGVQPGLSIADFLKRYLRRMTGSKTQIGHCFTFLQKHYNMLVKVRKPSISYKMEKEKIVFRYLGKPQI